MFPRLVHRAVAISPDAPETGALGKCAERLEVNLWASLGGKSSAEHIGSVPRWSSPELNSKIS